MRLPFRNLVFVVAGLSGFPNVLTAADAPNAPVGFITQTIAGGGTSSSPVLSVISPTLVRPVEWEGGIQTISPNATGPSTILVAGNPWTNNQFNGANGAFYVEIVSRTNSGALANIQITIQGVSPDNSSIITAENLSAFAAVGDTIKIRKHVTLGDFLGVANSAGLLASDDPATADEVLITDGASASSYFFYTGSPGFPAGWYDTGFALAPGAAASVVITPGQAVVVKRKAASPVAFSFSGTAKTRNTLLPIWEGLTLVGTVSAQNVTLGTSGLHTGNPASGVTASDDPSTGDEVTVYTPGGQTSYFYFTGYPGYPAGWYDSGFLLAPGEADAVTIPPGAALAISRKSGSAFYWASPAPASF